MKFIIFIFLLASLECCSNRPSGHAGKDFTIDTSVSATIPTDTTGAARMNADTTGMGNAK